MLKKKKNRTKPEKIFNAKLLISCFILVAILYAGLILLEHAIITEDETVFVYVAVQNVEQDTLITQDNLSMYFGLSERAVKTLPDGYLTKPEELIGHTVCRYLSKNNPVTSEMLVGQEVLLSDINDGIVVSFLVSALSNSVSGTVRPGDRVNIWRNLTDSYGNVKVFPVCKNAYILAAYDSSGISITCEDTQSIATMFDIMIPAETESVFHAAITAGGLRLGKISDEEQHETLLMYSVDGELIYGSETADKKESTETVLVIETETEKDTTENNTPAPEPEPETPEETASTAEEAEETASTAEEAETPDEE